MNLTKPQKLIYDMEKFAGGSINIICGSMVLPGEKDETDLVAAARRMVRHNDALRIRFCEDGGKAAQHIMEYAEPVIEVLRFDGKTELDSYAQDYAKIPLDFHDDLCELKVFTFPGHHGILAKLHHFIGDAWTLAMVGSQFGAFLNGEVPAAYSYCDYIENEAAYLESPRYANDRAFFLDQFKKCDEVTFLSEKHTDALSAARSTFVIDRERADQIKAYATQNKTSVYALFMTVLAIYINRIKMNTEKFYLGTAVLNRNGVREKNTMGMFVNTVPMLIELENDKSFAENLAEVSKTIFSVFRHQKFNYGDVLSAIHKEHNFSEKLYDVMLSYQNATITGGSCETTWYHSGMQNESLQIHIDDRDNEGIFRIHYDYQTDKFTSQEIAALHQHICNLLFDALQDNSKKIYELNILTLEEKKKLLFDFNDTAVDYPKDKCIHQLFEEQVQRTPDNIAVIACDSTLTYAQLNEQANRIAHSLIASGVLPGDIVAFALSRKSHLIAAMFGILKAGAAYLPVDPDYPQDRVDYMLSDSGAKLFITDINIGLFLKNDACTDPQLVLSSESLCYTLFTSGTTGNPKATMVKHRNLANFCDNNNNNNYLCALVNTCSTVLAVTTMVFDISVFEIFVTLLNGMTLVLADEEAIVSPERLAELICTYHADVIHSTPTKFTMYLENTSFQAAAKHLKMLMIGAEVFTHELLKRIGEYTDATVYNGYGPTETTIGVSFMRLAEREKISIGKPIANTQIYIVDRNMQLVPIGVTGELCIAGDSVGAGYLNRPELTAEKFVDNPFGEGKLYKTGDMAYWCEDGNIAYVGRNDFQVKIRGLRVELGEIENAICGIDGISQAVVVVRKNSEGRQLICAFYTGEEVEAKQIRIHIGKKLPKYMLPHIITHLDAMPLTTSGKVNRKAFPDVDLDNTTNEQEYVAPVTQMQKELCKLLETVLSITPIGLVDNFFDLGGDSLKAIEFVSKAHNKGIYFNLQNVFDYPTVGELVACIENGDKQAVSFADSEYTEINSLLEKNTVECITAPIKQNVGNILLAGATGFLGIHILADYLEHDTGTAYCLVRGRNKTDSTRRMKELLQFYFGNKYADMGRVEVVCADLQKDLFGLSQGEYNDLFSKVDMVINTAASVKHYGSYQYFYEANVETTKRLIDFCRQSGAKLIHTSTLSVSGNSFGDQFDGYVSETEKHFYETSLNIGQPLENVYARSKFEAEKAVLDAITEGLQANIMRMGNLTNRLSDGVFQRNHESNAFLQRVKAILDLGVFPDYLMPLYSEFTPIDEAASAIMTIARHFQSEQTVFHINSTKVVYMDKLLEHFRSLGFKMEIVSGSTFAQILRQIAKRSGMAYVFETFINDMDENEQLNYDSNIRIENDFTVSYLKTLGFEWADIGMEYLRKYVAYFKKIGYLR